jgi:GNAT superfamily N-acetyltransferase
MNYFRFSEQEKYNLSTVSQFNNHCFKIRGNHTAYDQYRFIDNPLSDKSYDFLYGVEKDNKYVAQMLTTPGALTFNENIIPAFWGQDYIVLEEYRGEGIGKGLSDFYLKKDYYIAVGFSEKSAIIHQKMGAKKIGYLDFYEKWGSNFSKLKFIFQRGLKIKSKSIDTYTFPKSIGEFELVESVEQMQLPNLNWNKDTIETIRNKAYLEWRFFYKKNRYFVYQSKSTSESENSIYFVVKPYFYKGVNWLRVIDYRYKIDKNNQFESLLNAVEKLRNELNLYGVLISSSLEKSNRLLEKNNFNLTDHEVVLSTYPFSHEENNETTNHFMISFADSDMDMHSNLGKFNYE